MSTVASKRRSLSSVDQFLQVVKAVMEAKGISIVALAEKSGLSRPYLSKVLSGHQKPSLEIADRIARPLGLEVRTIAVRKTPA